MKSKKVGPILKISPKCNFFFLKKKIPPYLVPELVVENQ
jgi:hypothetical protein